MKKLVKSVFMGFCNMSISNQIVIVCLLLVLFPLFLFVGFSWNNYNESVMSQIYERKAQTVVQMTLGFENYIEELVTLTNSSLYYDEGIDVLEQSNDGGEGYQLSIDERNVFFNMLFVLNYTRNDTREIYLFNNYDLVAYSSKDSWSNMSQFMADILPREKQFEDKLWYEKAVLNNGKPAFVTMSDFRDDMDEQKVFSIAKLLKKNVSGETIGAIRIDFTTAYFQEICGISMTDEYDNIVVLGPYGDVLAEGGDPDVCETLKENYSQYSDGENHIKDVTIDGVDYSLGVFQIGNDSRINVVWGARTHQVLAASNELQKNIIMTSIALFLVFILIFFIYIKRFIIDPFAIFSHNAKSIAQGNLDVRSDVKTCRETEKLSDSLNQMVDQIKDMLNNMAELGRQEKEAYYKALQFQVNPHFLNNTLTAIQLNAESNGDHETSEAIVHLCSLFRYSVKDDRTIVHLIDELDNAVNYVKVMQIRMNNELTLFVNCDEEMYHYTIPKFTLQPLIENAIAHGFENKEGIKSIIITAKKVGTDIILTVMDNGSGINEERLRQVKEMLKSGGSPDDIQGKTGVGIINVHRRIQLLFGNRYGIECECEPGEGTCIVIRLPLME